MTHQRCTETIKTDRHQQEEEEDTIKACEGTWRVHNAATLFNTMSRCVSGEWNGGRRELITILNSLIVVAAVT